MTVPPGSSSPGASPWPQQDLHGIPPRQGQGAAKRACVAQGDAMREDFLLHSVGPL